MIYLKFSNTNDSKANHKKKTTLHICFIVFPFNSYLVTL